MWEGTVLVNLPDVWGILQSIFPCVFYYANSVTETRHNERTGPQFPDPILSEDYGTQGTAP